MFESLNGAKGRLLVLGGVLSNPNLGGALLAAIAVRVTTGSAVVPGAVGAEIRYQTNAAFTSATEVLDAFAIVETKHSGAPALRVSAEQIEAEWQVSEDDFRFASLIASFLAVACHYDGLASGKSWFRPPRNYTGLLANFAESGFAHVQKDLFRWDASIAPYMAKAGLWSSKPPATNAQDDERRLVEARRAWAEMPVFVHRRFFRSADIDMVAFISVVAHSWDGTRWRPYTRARRFLDFPDARHLAERILELSAKSPKSGNGPV